MSDPIRSEHQQILDAVDRRSDRLEALIMESRERMEAADRAEAAAFADFASDVTATLNDLKQQGAAMQAAVEEARAGRMTAEALAASLQTQLDANTETIDAAVARSEALTAAMSQEDVAVDRPAGPTA